MKSTSGLGLICLGLSVSACQKAAFKSSEVSLSSGAPNTNTNPVVDGAGDVDPDGDATDPVNPVRTIPPVGNVSVNGPDSVDPVQPVHEPSLLETITVYRLINIQSRHVYTLFAHEAAEINYYLEGPAFQLYRFANGSRLMLYRCYNAPSGAHFVSPDRNCEGSNYEGELGYAERSFLPGLRPLRRMAYAQNGLLDHLITAGDVEALSAQRIGYNPEAVLGWVP